MDKLTYTSSPHLTFQKVYKQISQYRYGSFYSSNKCQSKIPTHLMEKDEKHGLPLMNKIFYDMVICNESIPLWTEFIEYYKSIYCEPLKEKEKKTNNDMKFNNFAMERGFEKNKDFRYTFQESYLNGKLMRAYMSFLKEIYVLTWLWKHGYYSAYWSLDADSNIGFDVMVNSYSLTEERKYGIKIYANTKDAKNKAILKTKQRHIKYPDITSISLISVISSESSAKLGDTYLFGNDIMYSIYNYIGNMVPGDLIIEHKEEILLC